LDVLFLQLAFVLTQLRQVMTAGESAEVTVKD
jgi:hypothetical protein